VIRAICSRVAAALAGAALLTLLAGSSAQASEAIEAFSVTTSTTQAGGHPDLGMSFTLASPGVPEAAKDVSVNTPEGIFGNPNAITKCGSEDFALERCPSSSQAGLITIRADYGGNPNALLGTAAIYDRQPVGDETALFGFIVPTLDIPISIPVAVRTAGDYGLRFTVSNMTQLAPLSRANLTFWGFPADEAHDPSRFPKGTTGCPGESSPNCLTGLVSAALGVQPMIDNPAVCTGQPLAVSLDVITYQDPANSSHADATYPASTGCESMTFKPVLLGTPTTQEADSPAGLDLQMTAAQTLGKSTTPSPIHSAVLTLPEGLTINPDAADGQTMCTDAQANFGTEGPAECPDNAKIGTFAIGTPSLDEPLTGSIYIGEPKPGDQYRLLLAADGFGIHAKLLASFQPDPTTGRLTARIENLPQVPFETFDLHLFASDRGMVATPAACGIYEVRADFFPWNEALPDQRTSQVFYIESGPHGTSCPGLPRPFHPQLIAGTSIPTAGAFSDFALKLDRDDGDQFLGDLNFTMPPGFTGDLRGISYCPEASIAAAAANSGRTEQATPSCPASSQIGTTNVAAGPGTHPFHAVGRMYLAGPFKGAPLSLVAITPALAGPYDYGTQVVRVALHVDPLTAQVKAISDTVPSIIGGIPLRLRSIQVNIDRADAAGNPNFTINPTNCSPMSVASQGVGDEGTVANFSSYFHVVNCRSLGFKPKMTVRQIGGRKNTRRGANPSLQFDLDTRPGDANIKSLAVTLSNAFEIAQNHLGNICSEKELIATQCAGKQAIGEARTETPLLDQPLSGKVYAVSGSCACLPRLAFILNGQVNLLPRAESKTVSGNRLQTTVPTVPDAPIGHFHLVVFGGKHGYLANSRSLCKHAPLVQIDYTAQNGKTRSESLKVKSPCGKSKARRKRHHG
jgi:hypothetical protein